MKKNPNGVTQKGGFKKALPILALVGFGLLVVRQAQGGVSFLPFGSGAPVYPASQWWYDPATGRYFQGSGRPTARAVPVLRPPEELGFGEQVGIAATRAAIPVGTSLVARWIENLFKVEGGAGGTVPLGVGPGPGEGLYQGFQPLTEVTQSYQPIQSEYGETVVLPEPTVVDVPIDLTGYMDYQEPVSYLDDFIGGEGTAPLALDLELLSQI